MTSISSFNDWYNVPLLIVLGIIMAMILYFVLKLVIKYGDNKL